MRSIKRAWWGASALGVLTAAVVLLGAANGPARRAPGVDIGTAAQAIDGGTGDAAARLTEDVTYGDTNLELLAVYITTGGALDGDIPDAHDLLWATVVRVLPPARLAEVRQLNIVTDGPNGTLAMVHRSGLVADRWILSVDTAETQTVLEATLVHELAHMLTLRRADVTTSTDGCDGVVVAIGCARVGSALAEWAVAFWTDPTQPAPYDRDEFVGEYAASAVHEDLAETFLAYVQGDEPRSPRVGEKYAFVANHPELAAAAAEVQLRLMG